MLRAGERPRILSFKEPSATSSLDSRSVDKFIPELPNFVFRASRTAPLTAPSSKSWNGAIGALAPRSKPPERPSVSSNQTLKNRILTTTRAAFLDPLHLIYEPNKQMESTLKPVIEQKGPRSCFPGMRGEYFPTSSEVRSTKKVEWQAVH